MAGRTPEPDDDPEPTPDADDVDARFAEIAAELGHLTLPPPESGHTATEDQQGRDADAPVGTPAAEPGPRDYTLDPETVGEDDPGFEPPEPEPLTGGDPLVALAWWGIAASVAVVFAYLVIWRAMPAALLALAGVSFLVSVGALLARMPGRREEGTNDDGAVV